MTKLDRAIARLRELSAEDRERVAEMIFAWTDLASLETYPLSDEERAAVRIGLDQAKRGEFVSDEEMERFWKRNRA